MAWWLPFCRYAALERVAQDAKRADESNKFLSAHQVCGAVGCTNFVLARLTSSIAVNTGDKEHVEVGLGLKFTRRRLQIAGYCRYTEVRGKPGKFRWEYTRAAVDLMKQLKASK